MAPGCRYLVESSNLIEPLGRARVVLLLLQTAQGVGASNAGQSQAALDLARGAAVCVTIVRLYSAENISK
jgi:hypothetical protein